MSPRWWVTLVCSPSVRQNAWGLLENLIRDKKQEKQEMPRGRENGIQKYKPWGGTGQSGAPVTGAQQDPESGKIVRRQRAPYWRYCLYLLTVSNTALVQSLSRQLPSARIPLSLWAIDWQIMV